MTATKDLAGLRILNTRPQAQAEKWRQSLERAGAATLRAGLMEIVPLAESDHQGTQAIKNIVLELDRYQHGIFVSQNAAHYGGQWLDQYWPQYPLGTHFYAVGSATAQVLQQQGFEVTGFKRMPAGCPQRGDIMPSLGAMLSSGTMDSESLLALPELQDVAGQRVVIFRGRGGRPRLGDVLCERGAQVDYCELYERQFPSADKLLLLQQHLQQQQWGQTGDLVAIHSGEGLQNWLRLIELMGAGMDTRYWQTLPLLLPGERVQQLARQLGFTQLITATNAADSTMIETLQGWPELSRYRSH